MHQFLAEQLKKLNLTPDKLDPTILNLLENISEEYQRITNLSQTADESLSTSQQNLAKLDRQLKAEHSQDEAIIQSMSEGLVVTDQEGFITMINNSAERLLALSAKSSIGRRLEDLVKFSQDSQPIAPDQLPIERAIREKKAVVLGLVDKISVQTGSQPPVPVSLSASPLRLDDQVTGVVLMIRNISDAQHMTSYIQKQVSERTTEVQEGRAQLMAAIRNLNIGFIMTDANLSIISVNNAAVRILGTGAMVHGELAVGNEGLTIESVDKQLGSTLQLATECRKSLTNKKPAEFNNVAFGELFLHIYISPITVGERSIGVAILAQDVTEARLLERSKDEFFSIASHELRTPLSAIRGNASMIEKFLDQIDKKDLQAMVHDIHDSSTRLIEMVRDFLDLSRLQQGKIKFEYSTFSLGDMVNDVVKELTPSAEQAGLYLKVDPFTLEVPPVKADYNRLRQVLVNLIGNAVKFTSQGGITVAGKYSHDWAVLSVSDTGRGISPEGQRLLFQKFEQTSENLLTRDTTRGTGLGLYISRLMMKGMNGTVKLVRSVPNRGSTFAFSIPLARATNTKPVANPLGDDPVVPSKDNTPQPNLAPNPKKGY